MAASLALALSLFAAAPRGALADDYAKTPGSNLVVKGGSPNMYRIADYMTKAFNLERAIEDNETGLGVALLGGRFCIGDHPSLAELRARLAQFQAQYAALMASFNNYEQGLTLSYNGGNLMLLREFPVSGPIPGTSSFWAPINAAMAGPGRLLNTIAGILKNAVEVDCTQPPPQTQQPPPPLLMTVTRPPIPLIELPPAPSRFCSEAEKADYLQTIAKLKADANAEIRVLLAYHNMIHDVQDELRKNPPDEKWRIDINGAVMPFDAASAGAALAAELTWSQTEMTAYYSIIAALQAAARTASDVAVVDCGPGTTGVTPPPPMTGVLTGLVRPPVPTIEVPPMPAHFCSEAEKAAFINSLRPLQKRAEDAISALTSYQLRIQERIDALYSNPGGAAPPISKLVINGQTVPYSVDALNVLIAEYNRTQTIIDSLRNMLGALQRAYFIPVIDCSQPPTTPQTPAETPPPPKSETPPPSQPQRTNEGGGVLTQLLYNAQFNSDFYNTPYEQENEEDWYNTPIEPEYYNTPFGYHTQNGWYVGPKAGLTLMPQQTFTTYFPDGGSDSSHVKFEPGFDVGVRIGDRMGPWRFEGQFDYTDDGFKFPSDETGYSGGTQTYSALANVIYDFHVPGLGAVTPHVGAGIGLAYAVTQEKFDRMTFFNSSNTQFAYQAIAGFHVPLSQHWGFDADYHYFATTPLDLRSMEGYRVRQTLDANQLLFSFTYSFH